MPLTSKRICITGGAGFIGSHLVQRLIEANEVVVYDNLHRNAIQFAHVEGHAHLHFIKGDVMDYDATRRALEGCQVVIHCAAIAGVYSVDRNAVTTMEVNMLGTHQVVKAALDVGVERFVEFSTSEVYGPFIHKGKEDDLTTIGPIGESRWVYAASKLASEHLSFAHYKEDGLPLAIVRPFNVYGPRQVGDGAVRGMILQALQHAPITLYNDGTRRSTSGPGCGVKTISDFDCVSLMIMFASSKFVAVPCGLPRLKTLPIASFFSAQRRTPSTKSST